MFKKNLRWPFFLLFAALLLAALLPILRSGYNGIAHAVANAPQITAAVNVAQGQPFQLQVQGFQASEQIQLSWNANGGQFLGMLTTDTTGAATNCVNSANCVMLPPTPGGAYTLTAIGGTSRLQASTVVNVMLNFVVNPQNVGPGSTVQVQGSGFQAGENLSIYFQLPANGATSTTADKTGSFTQSLTLPATYTPQTSYYVYAANAQNVVRARAGLSLAALSLTSSVTKVAGKGSITLSGKGFLAHEVISLHWRFSGSGTMSAGTVSADAAGNFTWMISAPTLSRTNYARLVAVGATSKLVATTAITLLASKKLPIDQDPRPGRRNH